MVIRGMGIELKASDPFISITHHIFIRALIDWVHDEQDGGSLMKHVQRVFSDAINLSLKPASSLQFECGIILLIIVCT